MAVKEQKKNKSTNVKRYRPLPVEKPPDYAVNVECSMCGRRACDLSALPQSPICVGLKCPHCDRIVHLQCAGA